MLESICSYSASVWNPENAEITIYTGTMDHHSMKASHFTANPDWKSGWLSWYSGSICSYMQKPLYIDNR